MIGYDDAQQVLTLHDPLFGPGWQVSYADFDKMWVRRFYLVAYPRDFAAVLAKRPSAPAYPSRTADQQAAAHFVFGYALRSVGQASPAEAHIAAGLAIGGVGTGYRHLLLLELAQLRRGAGDVQGAIAAAQAATALLPQHHRPWQLLAELYRAAPGEASATTATTAEGKAAEVCADPEAQRIVERTLARDFFMFGCRPMKLLRAS